jgi:hypothetical protein
LFARTTRSVSLTEAGARFIAGVEPALADIGKAVEGLTAERGQVTRLLRIEAPRGVLDTLLIPILSTGANRTSPFLVSTAYRYGQEMPGGVPPKTAPDTRYRFALDPQIDRRNLVGRRGRRAFVPTPEQRRNVKILAGLGIPQDKICLTVVNPHTDKPLDQ